MNIIYIIGGIFVFLSICALAYFYFQQAKELREAEERLDWCKPLVEEYFRIMDEMQSYEIASPEDVKDIKFGDF